MHQTENSTRAEAPTDTLRPVPVSLISDTMNVMARAYERIHSMPRVSDTELAIKVGEAKERLRPFLAPTAPVEASGSEREHGPKCWGGTSFSDGMAHCYCGSTDLRPQPSGETREAVARIVASEFLRQDYEPDATPADVKFSDGLSWSYVDQGSIDFGEIADRVIAYFDARPLALGGQKGEVECDVCKRGEVRHFSTDDGFWVEITTSAGGANEHGLNGWIETLEHYPDGLTKRREYVATDNPALSTTPARAEAQDEGPRSLDASCKCFGDIGMQASTYHDTDDKERCDLCGGIVSETFGEGDR